MIPYVLLSSEEHKRLHKKLTHSPEQHQNVTNTRTLSPKLFGGTLLVTESESQERSGNTKEEVKLLEVSISNCSHIPPYE